MKASLRWLRDFVGDGLTASQARELLTARCATVESVETAGADLAGILVARVVEVERHPESDRLWLTKVDAGAGELLEVVCGAPNVSAGTLYPFAPVGATLPGGLKIERRKIRGRASNGMLCSARELGLGTDHEGILALDVDADPGSRFADVAATGDFRLEIDVLPNRPDLLSHRGLARELAAAMNVGLRDGFALGAGDAPRVDVRAAHGTSGEVDGVSITIEDADGCQRYAAVIIRGVKVGPSPRELVERLEGVGVRPINNIVDATNYMLHGYGQPMHAFDLTKLGPAVVVRRARPGEKVVTLDGVERALPADTTVIAGAERGEAVGGVLGGRNSEVAAGTTDVLLEVAAFDPRRIRRTRRALGISTDASYRFERHVDASAIPELAARAAALIIAVAGGEVTGAVDVIARPVSARTVMLRPQRAARVIGEPIDAKRTAAMLRAVGFDASGDAELEVKIPSWRSDVVEEIDLIEEVARLSGYDAVSSDLRPFRPSTVPDDRMVAVAARVRDALVGAGLMEIRPMPFAGAGDRRLRVRNPLADDEAYLRSDLVTTLVGRVEHNLAHMQRAVRLFEIGTVFAPGDSARPVERTHVAVALCGDAAPAHFTAPVPRSYDAWDAKYVAELIARSAFNAPDVKLYVNNAGGGAHPSLWTVAVAGTDVGRVCVLALDAPAWAAPAYAVEVDITSAAELPAVRPLVRPLPVTPAAEFDLALIVPDEVPAARVEQVLRTHGGEILERVLLFDEFRGAGVPEGTRSLAWRLTFRHPGRTLRDKEIEARREKLLRSLETELGVKKRTS